jgi:hypothetical protein
MDLALVLRVLEALDLRIALEVKKRPRDDPDTVQTFEAADRLKIWTHWSSLAGRESPTYQPGGRNRSTGRKTGP